MRRAVLFISVVALLIVGWNMYQESQNPFPQFTDEMNEQICIEEGIY